MEELSLEKMERYEGRARNYTDCVIEKGLETAVVAGISGWIAGGFWRGWIGGIVVGAMLCYGKY